MPPPVFDPALVVRPARCIHRQPGTDPRARCTAGCANRARLCRSLGQAGLWSRRARVLERRTVAYWGCTLSRRNRR
ncbi:hypothetical protein C8R44DRAFT_762393 [Mycena epipterygia]|nr:hypothetical protein C8R44DRAFT_762393 [Mycena epipterygia]